jgi:hypothetical protein
VRKSFVVEMNIEATRDRFVEEFVRRGPGTVGLEANLAGHADARRRFALAIQGWEKNLWIRPFLTRLEGHFEKMESQEGFTRVIFVTRGIGWPLTFVSLLFPYWVAMQIPRWPPPHITWTLLIIVACLTVPAVGAVFYAIERRIYRLLIQGLLAAYDRPPLENAP